MDLVIFGLNHTTAPLEIRERFSFKPDEASNIMDVLRSTNVFLENLLVSTCNRTEVYGLSDRAEDSVWKLHDVLASSRNCSIEQLKNHGYLHLNSRAVQHLFKVSAGLDSLVVGEVEILGQLKDAYRTATGVDTTGPYLNKLFHHCFRVGKRVRNETAISSGGISVGSSAVDLAVRVIGDLSRKKVLLIGAGETGRLVARHLVDMGIGALTITNRTQSKAEELVSELGGDVLPFDAYPKKLSKYNLIITAVGAPERSITKQMLKRVRGMYPLMIDLGVPRDIDPEIEKLSNAFVYHVDDLQAIVEEKLTRRKIEVPKVEAIITEEAARFISWSDSLRAQKTIEDLRAKLENHRDVTLDRWKGRMDPHEVKMVEQITREMLNKILHDPVTSLKGCELEDTGKHCERCDMFDRSSGCIHGHFNQELKCIVTRSIFAISDPEPAEPQTDASSEGEDT